ncbi:hypothetical protein A6A04_05720 [Paramagnetospirillum marisnigri]|uniref:Uncharacterized protein n=1 Tax=Paramagnetospirillum marisnigri TaxID=1285242 RepID=A0A178MCS8_9PROT|nr:hypothetical protein [Paramagnetospirillum marisnigri]OAN46610.1 hypothetical protein A6A04_05720 [Paramagnetospirillum marisnigri]
MTRIFRFSPLVVRSIGLLAREFPTFLRLSWFCLAVSLLSLAVSARHPLLGGIADLMAHGVFATVWMRLVAMGERPLGLAYFRLGRREVFVALGWMLAETFVAFPAHVISASLSMATGLSVDDALMPMLALAHLLLGVAYLLAAEAALEPGAGRVGWRLPDLVMKGGMAVSVAVLLAWLPANLLLEGVLWLPQVDLLDGLTLADAGAAAVRYLAMAVTGGTLALVWMDLSAGAEG